MALRRAAVIGSGSLTGYGLWRRSYDPLHVVWDLDGTLLCSVSPIPDTAPHGAAFDQIDDDFPFEPDTPNTRTFWRPGARAALAVVGCFAEQHVFTAAQETYAANILAELDPDRTRFASVLHRDAVPECVRDGKDLARVVGAENLRRVVLVDDRARNFAPQGYENGIRTPPYDALTADAMTERLEMARIVGVSFLAFLAFDARRVVAALDDPERP